MWLSKQTRPKNTAAGSDLGVTTISGGSAGVVTRGEVRDLPVYGPGGYVWKPATGQTVLVIKGGTGGEETCVAGAEQKDAPGALAPGEVYIHSGGGSVCLRNNGTVEIQGGSINLSGRVNVTGSLYINGQIFRPCTCG